MDNPYRGNGSYQVEILEDTSVTYEIEEHGRKVQFHKGKNGRRIITDLGRDKKDLERAFALLGKNAIRFDEKERIVQPIKRNTLVENVTLNNDVTDNLEISVTNDAKCDISVTRRCIICDKDISDKRADVRTCSPACRKKASRL